LALLASEASCLFGFGNPASDVRASRKLPACFYVYSGELLVRFLRCVVLSKGTHSINRRDLEGAPHSRMMRPEHSRAFSSGSTKASTCSPFRSSLGERSAGGVEGGEAPPASSSVPKAGPGHALADCPPPTIPVKCAPADRPSHTLQRGQAGTRSTEVTLKT
jgi:hypothetical protein